MQNSSLMIDVCLEPACEAIQAEVEAFPPHHDPMDLRRLGAAGNAFFRWLYSHTDRPHDEAISEQLLGVLARYGLSPEQWTQPLLWIVEQAMIEVDLRILDLKREAGHA